MSELLEIFEKQKFKSRKEIENYFSVSPFFFKCKFDEDLPNLVLLSYQIKTKFGHSDEKIRKATRQARGIIIDWKEIKIVSYGFDKFFNIHEEHAGKVNFTKAKATEKIDGSLIKISTSCFIDKKPLISTSNCIQAKKAKVAFKGNKSTTYQDLLEETELNKILEEKKLDPNTTYCFELVHPLSTIKINYELKGIFHLTTRSNEPPYKECEADIGVPKPKEFKFKSLLECYNFARNEFSNKHEGIVVCDLDTYERLKIKSISYLKLLGVDPNVNPKNIYLKLGELIRKNQMDDFYFQDWRPFFDKILFQAGSLANEIHNLISSEKFSFDSIQNSQKWKPMQKIFAQIKYWQQKNENKIPSPDEIKGIIIKMKNFVWFFNEELEKK
eukprot:Anaeramoba_ignava/a611134_75.p1 GENE.a611134_75~~a611134_75.p1  ORF type:complete len:385 (+),score=130.30 a611134_75:129-1283(+)